MTDPAAFGARLRRQREQRGISLQTIADSTKVGASHFAALERGDCSHWPAGVYSRAFVRAYAEAIGLDPDTVASDFFQCHPALAMAATAAYAPASRQLAPSTEPAVSVARGELRLMLEDTASERVREHAARLLRVLMELAAILVAAAIIGAVNGQFWMALAIALVTRQIVGALTIPRRSALQTLATEVDPSPALPDAELVS